MPPQFRHRPLDASTRQIRVVRVDAIIDGIPHCSLSLLDLDLNGCSPFKALSYVWGPMLPQRTIYIEGHEFSIRQNLFDFLQTSHASAHDHLWVDQICIDQQDVDERNHQVQLMADIYSNAVEVLIWLGLAENSDICAINHIAERQYDGYIENALRARYTELATDPIYTMPSEALQPPPEPLFSCICKFLEKSYWNRLWIVQEIFLGKARKIVCGDHTLSWESFHAYTFPSGSPKRDTHLSGAFQLSSWTTKHSYVGLDTVLDRFSGKDCEDPRDKIFGLQALVEPEQRMAVDYSKSPMQVFVDSFVHALDSPFGRPANLRRASDFCHKCTFGSTVIILPALPGTIACAFPVEDFYLLATQRARVASHMGIAANHSLL